MRSKGPRLTARTRNSAPSSAKMETWKDSVIYFVLIDRFSNGDPANDDFGKGEYNPQDDEAFHGGDLKGLIKRLRYIKGLGFDAIWITPPVHNQWINPSTPCRGYHGYWPYDFTAIDPHFGSLEDFRKLVSEAHKLGIRVIQDIVVNHSGNYFTVDPAKYSEKDPSAGWQALEGALPPEDGPKAPRDPVFGMNNPNIPEHREAAVYNFTPPITNFKDREQTLKFSLGDLDDINLEAPLAARRMREIYRDWIDKADIDGFRIDTVYYTPESFYEGFCHSQETGNEGVKAYAKKKGKKDFLVFGEAWTYDHAALNGYIRGKKGEKRLDSAIDFPLNEALVHVFYKKESTEILARALKAKKINAPLWVNFLDNHDVERVWARANPKAVHQSLVALFTLPGIPCVYYGTECGFKKVRENMFSEKHLSRSSPHQKFLRQCIRLRKEHPALSRGKLDILKAAPRSGVLAFERSLDGEELLVVFNTALGRMYFEFPDAKAKYETVFPRREKKASGGHLLLEPESYTVFRKVRSRTALPRGRKKSPTPKITLRKPRAALRGTVELAFKMDKPQAVSAVYLLANSDYGERTRISAPNTGRALLDTRTLGNGTHTLEVLAQLKDGRLVSSNECTVKIENPYVELASLSLTAEESRALNPRVLPPAEPSYNGQCTIRKATLLTSGKDLQLKLTMESVSQDWNPPVGFDHVYFHIFFQLPGLRKGKPFLPKLGYAPKDFRFNVGFLLYGWETLSFGDADSTETSYGKPLHGAIESEVDLPNKEIRFTFSKEHFAGIKSFEGLKAFISTWDGYLGNLRSVASEKQDWEFYVLDGAPAAHLPKIFSAARLEVPPATRGDSDLT